MNGRLEHKIVNEKLIEKSVKQSMTAMVKNKITRLKTFFLRCLNIFIPAERIRYETQACIPRKA